MLYILNLTVFLIWVLVIIRSKQLSWHTLVACYALGVFIADVLEVTFNLLLDLYKFPTHLLINPSLDNELGIIIGDTLILPFAFIIYIYYARNYRPWRITLIFTLFFILIEWVYITLGFMYYIKWGLAISSLFYLVGYRITAHYAPRIANYNPPIPYTVFLLCFSHTFIMWAGAIFASPVLRWYQFNPGFFSDFMADCRFTDLLSGEFLAVLCALILPRIRDKAKPLALAIIAGFGLLFSLFSYSKGWLIYHSWNHFLMALRYILPLALIYVYDRWETGYRRKLEGSKLA